MRWAAWILVIGVACVGLDHMHATHGVLTYPTTFRLVWSQPLFVWPLFIGAAAASIFGATLVRRWAKATEDEPPLSDVVGDTLSFLLAYASTSYFYQHPTALAGVLGGFWVVRVLRAPRWLVVMSLASGVIGPLVEMLISSLGGFDYVSPESLVRVPRWLPCIYLHAGVVAGTVASRLTRRAALPAPR